MTDRVKGQSYRVNSHAWRDIDYPIRGVDEASPDVEKLEHCDQLVSYWGIDSDWGIESDRGTESDEAQLNRNKSWIGKAEFRYMINLKSYGG
jgi:hypothetical protein